MEYPDTEHFTDGAKIKARIQCRTPLHLITEGGSVISSSLFIIKLKYKYFYNELWKHVKCEMNQKTYYTDIVIINATFYFYGLVECFDYFLDCVLQFAQLMYCDLGF